MVLFCNAKTHHNIIVHTATAGQVIHILCSDSGLGHTNCLSSAIFPFRRREGGIIHYYAKHKIGDMPGEHNPDP